MKRHFTILPIIAIVLLSFSTPGNAQQLRLSAEGGLSRVLAPNFEQWEWGYSAGGALYFHITENLKMGARLIYNRWTPDETEFTEAIENLVNGEVNGEAWSFEVVPTIRLSTAYASSINLFALAGAGLYFLNTEATVTGTVGEDDTFEEVFGEGTETRFGVTIGAGLNLGGAEFLSLDIFPTLTLVFLPDSEQFRYFTINAAIALGI